MGNRGNTGVYPFAHPSEGEFAQFLDFYQVEWFYEPTSFALRWDESGRVVESMKPDFFLPEFGLYIELTTMRQRLVTRKNRKLRRLRQLYPEVKIKILYKRDFQRFRFKCGSFA